MSIFFPKFLHTFQILQISVIDKPVGIEQWIYTYIYILNIESTVQIIREILQVIYMYILALIKINVNIYILVRIIFIW